MAENDISKLVKNLENISLPSNYSTYLYTSVDKLINDGAAAKKRTIFIKLWVCSDQTY